MKISYKITPLRLALLTLILATVAVNEFFQLNLPDWVDIVLTMIFFGSLLEKPKVD